jgi:hypothetical protein
MNFKTNIMTKKLIACFALVSFLAFSCKKEAPLQPQNGSLPVAHHNPKNPDAQDAWGLNWWWIPAKGFCIPYPLDCFDEVVVSPTLSTAVTDFENAVASGSGGVSEFFQGTEWDDLFPDLDDTHFPDQLEALQSGNYHISESISDDDGLYQYAVIEDGTSTISFVLRLNKKDL